MTYTGKDIMGRPKKVVAKTPPIDINALLDETVAEVVDRAPRDTDTPTGETLRWATDCYWVAENLDERMSKTKAGTTFRFALWKHARENMDTFIGQMLPKAMAILDRQMSKNTDDGALVKHEDKGVAELERILRGVIHEALVTSK